MTAEEGWIGHILASGSCMPNYEYMDIPGMDYYGNFYISGASQTVNNGNLATLGFPFFAGNITLKKTVSLIKEECIDRCLEFSQLGATVTSIKFNGKPLEKIMWQPYTADLSNVLNDGENTFEITITTNLRNLLGPFHLKVGENISVSPGDFFHNSSIWCKVENSKWTDSYCFVKHGLFFK